MTDPLAAFSLPVRSWFRAAFGQPTPPQAAGWLPIQCGEHTLILAPTGSGKTLAAFLWGIDQIYRELEDNAQQGAGHSTHPKAGSDPGSAIHLLYISPLKALNNDIERNLRGPLVGIRETAARLGQPLPALRVAVRTGDTPGAARAAMLRQPPHILITTPESLFLLLTSPRAREMLRTVHSVIVDEIHTLVGEKRGVHLALSLERLEHLVDRPVQRIGLSATIRPLEEAARFLGGQAGEALAPRPVTIVDTGYRKSLDLRVVMPVADFRDLPGDSIWPSVIPHVLGEVMRRRSTLIFCNNRRLAERTADRLNAQIAAERSEEIAPGSTEALAPGGVMRDRGIFAIGAEGPIRAHHGSISRQARQEMEENLKAGRLPALVATSTLELGIDIGAVDLVVQLQSPKSVGQGLQRVGRSGHLVGQTATGRIYATHREDLVEAAAVVAGMLDGDVEPTQSPENPLDVLAQQVLAAVAVEEWDADALHALVRGAYPYRSLPRRAWESVLAMLAGHFQAAGGPGHGALRARLVWERDAAGGGRLAALPGARLLALSNAGTIPDTGAYDVYLADGKTRVGTLDEEFVFETRPGDTFLLGSGAWRVVAMQDDRIIVGEAAGSLPRMPFWRGDYPWRPYELGVRIGRLRREVAEQIRRHGSAPERVLDWLRSTYLLDNNAAQALLDYVSRQLDAIGEVSSDETIVVETFADAVGDARVVVHSPFGGRVNGAWALALADSLREKAGIEIETQVNDDGILLRFPGTALHPPTEPGFGEAHFDARAGAAADLVARMTAAEARERILAELPSSAVFGARFRMNAARALLLPRSRAGKRTPFWLQRLKARDLLATVRNLPDFPIVAETARDCLRDVLDLPHLAEVLGKIEDGRMRVLPVETVVPSPLASGLLYAFISVYMYEWDTPKAERQLQALALGRELVDDLLAGAGSGRVPLKAEMVADVVGGQAHIAAGRQARTPDELAAILLELGDLTAAEAAARCAGDAAAWLGHLANRGRIRELHLLTSHGPEPRWTPVELIAEYAVLIVAAEGDDLPCEKTESAQSGESASPALAAPSPDVAFEAILRRYLRAAGPVTRAAILDRYAFPGDWLNGALARLLAARAIVQGHFTHDADRPLEYCDRHLFEQLYRRTLVSLRREIQPVPFDTFAGFLLRWQGLAPHRRADREALAAALGQLRGLELPAGTWEHDVLPVRVAGYRGGSLDTLLRGGEYAWACTASEPRHARVRFLARWEGGLFLGTPPSDEDTEGDAAAVQAYLRAEGPSFAADLRAALGWPALRVRQALAQLALAARVTGQDMAALHAVLAGERAPSASDARRPASALAEELAERLSPRPPASDRRTRQRLHEARRRVAERVQAEITDEIGWDGRWSLIARAAISGPVLLTEERGTRLARLALARYGVVAPELLARNETRWEWRLEGLAARPPDPLSPLALPAAFPWPWPEIYGQLQRMELRGEVRRGYFVAGLSGVQFALAEAIDALRDARDAVADDDRVTVLSALDPANVYGGASGNRQRAAMQADSAGGQPPEAAFGTAPHAAPDLARVPSTHLVLWRGRPALAAEDSGARLTAGDVPPAALVASLRAYLARPNAPRRTSVTHWDGSPVLGSPGEPLLRELGATRGPAGMEVWAGGQA